MARDRVGGREHPVFIDVVAFGELAEEAVVLTKGQRVWVYGRLDQRDWTTGEGLPRSTQIVARRLEALEPPRRRPAPTIAS
jgi:single-stranded DNA-binding protein